MERFKSLNQYQKGFLAAMLLMSMVFALVYAVTISKVGFAYRDTIFVPTQEEGNTVYSASLEGQKAYFTVSEDQTVVFQYGDITYGPYIVKEDSTAIPQDHPMKAFMTGVAVYRGEEIHFRGAVYESGANWYVCDADGSPMFTERAEIIFDENGNITNPMEPSSVAILELLYHPELIHKGDWAVWILAVCICIVNAFTILFADELFRFHLAFQIRHADYAEPSDWEIISRYVSWILLIGGALTIFTMGLK